MEHIVTVNPAWDSSFQVDLPITSGSVRRVSAASVEAGGKGVNVASMLRELGLPHLVPAQALIAGDARFVAEAAKRCGNVKKIGAVESVRTNLTLGPNVRAGTDAQLRGQDVTVPATTEAKLNSPGWKYTPDQARALREEILAGLSFGDTLVLSGSLCPGMESDFYARLTKAAHDRGAWAVVDASGASLREAWSEADIVAPNGAEARELYAALGNDAASSILQGLEDPDCEADVLRAGLARLAKALGGDRQSAQPHWVLLTLGAHGAALIGEGYVFYAAAPDVAVCSTVGAGDAALAGALWARAQKLDPPEWLRWAVACGSAATETSGSATPRYERICHLVVSLEVESLSLTTRR